MSRLFNIIIHLHICYIFEHLASTCFVCWAVKRNLEMAYYKNLVRKKQFLTSVSATK